MSVQLQIPVPEDGAAVHQLIERCKPLDTNSMYCNLLQCTHFADTSVVAYMGNEIVGFVSGYLVPGHPDTLFIWQVAVAETARGQGLAGRMLRHILERPTSHQVGFVEATIGADNKASWALFEALAKDLGAELQRSVMFDEATHFNNQHESELLARVGPFSR